MPEYPTNPKYSALHYYDLAEFIKGLPRPLVGIVENERDLGAAKCRIAERLADRFTTDNPAFDRERFLEACGMEPPRPYSTSQLTAACDPEDIPLSQDEQLEEP